MRNIFLYILLLSSLKSWAQKDTLLHIHKFPNGKISTICVLKDQREGYAKAFDFSGKVIYEMAIRRYGGSSGVDFTHHANGMVKKAHYSSQPDGGIQWYRLDTYFDENGNKTGEIEDNWDTRPTVPNLHFDDTSKTKPYVVPTTPKKEIVIEPKHVPTPPKQEVIACATIHKNRVEFLNHSKNAIYLSVSHAGKDTILVLKSGKTFIGPTYISAEIASPMNQNIRYQFSCKKKKCELDSTTKVLNIAKDETLHTVNFYGRRKRMKQ